MPLGFLAGYSGFEAVLCAWIFALDLAVCVGIVVEKAGLLYEGAAFVFTAYRTIWHHDTFTDVILPIFLAVLFAAAGLLYRYFQQHGIKRRKGEQRLGTLRRIDGFFIDKRKSQ